MIRKIISFCWTGGWFDNCWKSARSITVNIATENENAPTVKERNLQSILIRAWELVWYCSQKMSFVYNVHVQCTQVSRTQFWSRIKLHFVYMWSMSFCSADVGVHHDDEKKNYLYLVLISWKRNTSRQSDKPAVFLFFALQKDYVRINLHPTISVKGWKNVFTS